LNTSCNYKLITSQSMYVVSFSEEPCPIRYGGDNWWK
jgi:hypothetical protein